MQDMVENKHKINIKQASGAAPVHKFLSVSGKVSRMCVKGIVGVLLLVLACPVHRLVAVDTSACGHRESGRDPVF